jgi:hypothetical protein
MHLFHQKTEPFSLLGTNPIEFVPSKLQKNSNIYKQDNTMVTLYCPRIHLEICVCLSNFCCSKIEYIRLFTNNTTWSFLHLFCLVTGYNIVVSQLMLLLSLQQRQILFCHTSFLIRYLLGYRC